MNDWVSGITRIFDSVATNFSNVWASVHAPASAKVPAASPQTAAPSSPSRLAFDWSNWLWVAAIGMAVVAVFLFVKKGA